VVTAGYPALSPVIPVPQIALQVRIVLNGRVQDIAGYRVVQGNCNSGHMVLKGKEYCSVQKSTWYCRV